MISVTLPPYRWLGPLPELPRAACKDAADPDDWFTTDPDVMPLVQQVCGRCPERGPCLAFAIEHGITIGVWCGTAPDERAQPARHRAAPKIRAGMIRTQPAVAKEGQTTFEQ